MRMTPWNRLRRFISTFSLLFLILSPITFAADVDGDGYDDATGADNCPGLFNPGQENSETITQYDNTQLMVASNIGDWAERFNAEPRTTTFVDATNFAIGNLVDGNKTVGYEDFWFNHGDEANPGAPAELVIKLPAVGMVTQIVLNNVSAPADVSDPTFLVTFATELGDYNDPSLIPGGWLDVPTNGGESAGTILSGQEVNILLSNPITARYIKVALVSDTARVTLNEIEIFGNPENVGDACDTCWNVQNADQADSNGNCSDPEYATDPLCGDVCEPLPMIFIENVSSEEGDSGTTDLIFRVQLSAARWEALDDITFDYETVEAHDPILLGDAQDGVDYENALGSATIPAGASFVDIAVTINGDTVREEDEVFFLNITNIAGSVSSTADLSATGTITNNDALPVLSVANPESVEEGVAGEGSPSPMVITFSLSNQSDQDVTFTYTINDVTTNASDYTAPVGYGPTSGTATIAAFEESTTVTVAILDDEVDEEASETFTVTISSTEDETIATVATAPDHVVTGTITDEDVPEIALPGEGDLVFAEGDEALFIDSTALLTAAQANYDTGNLSIEMSSGGSENDRLTIVNNGALSVLGANVRYSGQTFATWVGGTDGSTPLVMTFNINATQAKIQALMRSIQYQNVSENPTETTRTIRYILTNGSGDVSNQATRDVLMTAINNAPTLNDITDPAIIDEDTTTEQIINLTGISSGSAEEEQDLLVTVTSSNEALVLAPSVTYSAPETTAILRYTPLPDENGSAIITVTVTEVGATENATVQKTFTINVAAVNDQPTLTDIPDPAPMEEDASVQTINFEGVGTGATNESQTITVSATSNNTDLIPDPTVTYTSPEATGSFAYTPVPNAYGIATITVTVSDGGGGTETIVDTFDVVISEMNDTPTIDEISNPAAIPEETSEEQVISLTGISSGTIDEEQTLLVTAVSDNTDLIPHPIVAYTSPETSGTLTYIPVPDAFGEATITVTIDDGAVENNLMVRTFVVSVTGINDQPTLDDIVDPEAQEEDSGEQTVSLSGIGIGSLNEDQSITITATSDNIDLIPNPIAVTYDPFVDRSTASIAYTPIVNGNGSAIISVVVSDGGGGNESITKTLNVVIDAVNDAPTLGDIADPLALPEDTTSTQTIHLSGLSTGATNESQTLIITAASSNTAVIPHPTINFDQGVDPANATLTYVPVFDVSGTATVTVTVTELGALENGTVEKTFTVVVDEINDKPTLDPISNPTAINEDTTETQTINLTNITSGSEKENQTLTITVTSSNTDLIPDPVLNYVSPQNTGTLTYIPVADANGSATITVTLSDGEAENATIVRSFEVVVDSINDLPTLDTIPDPDAIEEDVGPQEITLTGISTGALNELQELLITATSNNTAVIPDPVITYSSPEGTALLTYESVLDTSGSAVITITIDDGQALNNEVVETFIVTVNDTNDRPTLDTIDEITIDEDLATPYVVDLTGISTGAPNETQEISIIATSNNTSVIPHPTINYVSPNIVGTLSFSPEPDANGTATISVSVTESGATENNTVVQEFVIIVNAINDQPTLDVLSDPAPITEDTLELQTINLFGIGTGAANENDTLTVTATSSDTSIIPYPSVNYTSAQAFGSLSYIPVPGGYGTAVITVTISDAQDENGSVEQSFNVQVVGVNNPPTLDAITNPDAILEDSGEQNIALSGINSGAANEDQELVLTASSSNTDLISDLTIHYLSPETEGSLVYTPLPNANGTTIITVTVNDGSGGAETVVQTFEVSVTPVNDLPTLAPVSDLAPINEDAPEQSVNLSGISSGQPDETEDIVVISATSSDTSIIQNPTVTYTSQDETGTLFFRPEPNAHGTVLITLTVEETGALENGIMTETFSVTVDPVNDFPTIDTVLNPDPIEEDTVITQTITLEGITTGAVDEIQALTVTALSSDTSLIPHPSVTYTSPNETATLTYVPMEDMSGMAIVTITITEEGSPENGVFETSFDVTVEASNDRPTIDTIPNPAAIQEDDPEQSINLAGISTGAANEDQLLVITAISSNTSLIPTPTVTYTSPGATGLVHYTPVQDEHGTATITVTVTEVGATQNVSTERSFEVVVDSVNDQPTIEAIDNPAAINEDAGEQIITFEGVSTGAANEDQELIVTVTSSETDIIPTPTITYTSPEGTGSVAYTPLPESFGTATITISISDGSEENAVVTETFEVTVSGINNAPTLDPIASPAPIDEDASLQTMNVTGLSTGSINEEQTLFVTATSSDPSIIPDPTIDYVSPEAAGTLSYTPVPDASGTATITVMVNDGGGGTESFTQEFQVVVNAVNDQPTLDVIGPSSLNEDTGEQTVNLSGISTGAVNEIQELTISAISNNESLIPNPVVVYTSPDGTGSLVYTPVPDQFGDANITITVTEPGATENGALSRSFDITVALTNDAPTLDALSDPAPIEEDAEEQVVNLSGISAGAANENQTLLVTATSSDTSIIPDPVVTYNSADTTGTITYAPVADTHGTALITVTVSELGAIENATTYQTFSVVVNPVNDQPTLEAIENPLAIDEDTVETQTIELSNISSGALNEDQTLIITATSSDPSIIPDPGILYAPGLSNGTLSYVPLNDVYGTADITVTITEEGATENATITQIFTVEVTAINDQPTLDSISAPEPIDEGTTFVPSISLTGISTGSLFENQTLVITATSNDPSLIPDPVVTYHSPEDVGSLSYELVPDAFGTATITVTVSDGGGGDETFTQTFDVVVNAINDQPTIDSIENPGAINEDNIAQQIINISGISTGVANEVQTISITAFSDNPDLITNPIVNYNSPDPIGNLTYAAVADAFGTATVTVIVSDGGGGNETRIRTFEVLVTPVNDQPTLGIIPAPDSVEEDASEQTINLSGISSGSINEDQALLITATSSDTNLIPDPMVTYTSPEATASLAYTPREDASGTATITVTVADGEVENGTITQTFEVVVTPINDQPTLDITPNPESLSEGAGTQTYTLTGISTGAADEDQNLNIVAASDNPSIIPAPTVTYVSPEATATLTYTPEVDAFGVATITISLSDNSGGNQTMLRTFEVQIDEVNDVPTLDSITDPNPIMEDDVSIQTINLTGISTGAANEIQNITILAVSNNPDLIADPTVHYTSPENSGTLNYAAAADRYGTAEITVTVTDTGTDNNTITETFFINVTAENDQPTLDAILNPTPIEEDAAEQTILLTGIGTGSLFEEQTLSLSASSDNLDLIPHPTVTYTSPEETATLVYTPVPDANGMATITVTLTDGGGGTETIERLFDIAVNAVNDQPTLEAINDPTPIMEDAGIQTLDLTGITVGALNENQSLAITTVSDNPTLIPNPTVEYASPTDTGTLTFRPERNVFGEALITVTVTESGEAENNTVEQTFSITVNAINDDPTLDSLQNMVLSEDDPWQTVDLTGISSGAADENQELIVTVVSSDPSLLSEPTVIYTSPEETGSFSFAPLPERYGTAVLTVIVEEVGAGENAFIERSLEVVIESVNDVPTLDPIDDLAPLEEEDLNLQSVTLNGISTGAENENQTMIVSAHSDNQTLLPDANININYTSPEETGTLTFTIAPDASGVALVTVTVTDGGGGEENVSQTFQVTVNAVNDQPTLAVINDPVAINEGAGEQTISLSGITSGSPNEDQFLTITAESNNPDLLLDPVVTYSSPEQTAILTYTPQVEISGTATITVTVTDEGSGTNTVSQTFDVTVISVNDLPTLAPIANPAEILEGDLNTYTINLSGITTGSIYENQTLTVTALSSDIAIVDTPEITYTSPDTTGILTYSAEPEAFGTVSITVTVFDEEDSVEQSFDILVGAVNDQPTIDAIEDPLPIKEESGQQIINFSGVTSGAVNEIQTLSVSAESDNPSLIPNPVVTYNSPEAGGSLTYTPQADTFGTATITLTVSDGQPNNGTVQETFVVVVDPINDQPTLDAISDPEIISEDASEQTINLSGIGTGSSYENQTLSITATSDNSTLIPDPVVTYISPETTGSLAFTPAPDEWGTATITVTVSDGEGQNGTVEQTFLVTVTAENDDPTLDSIENPAAILENAEAQSISLSGISGGAVNEAETITITAVSSDETLLSNPTVIYTSPEETGSLVYTPVPDAWGTATITVEVDDGTSLITQSFDVVVELINDVPTLDPLSDPASIEEDAEEQNISLSGITTGAENEIQDLEITATSSNTDLITDLVVTYVSPDTVGSIAYTPVANAYGTTQITVTVSDGLDSLSQTFNVTVESVNDAPTLETIVDPEVINEDASEQSITLSGISTGNENEDQTLVLSATSSNTAVIPNPTIVYHSPEESAILSYTPVADAWGTAVVTVSISDGATENATRVRLFTIVVKAVNDQPVLDTIDDPASLPEDSGEQILNITGIGSGAPDENQTLTITAVSDNTDLIPHPTVTYDSPEETGTLVYTPVSNAYGNATISVTISDGGSVNSTLVQTFQITVDPLNDQPTLENIPNPTAIEEDASEQTINLSGVGTGASNEVQTLSITAVSSNPLVIPDPTVTYASPDASGTLTFTPVLNASGSSTITVTLSDGGTENETIVRTFEVGVNATNDAPTMETINDPEALPENAPPQLMTLTGISTGADDEDQELQITAVSSNTSVVATPVVTYTSPEDTATLSFVPVLDAFGLSTITVTVTEVGATENATIERTFGVSVNYVNTPPTLDAIANPEVIMEDTTEQQTILLSGISTGAPDENQLITITAESRNEGIISDPIITYTSPNETATLVYTPLPNAAGLTTVTVFVSDNGGGEEVREESFEVLVTSVNDQPTLDAIVEPAPIIENAGAQNVNLTGITSGAANEVQVLAITAVSSDISLIPDPVVNYTSPDSTATLTYTPVPEAHGTATITVTVSDNNGGNETVTQSFVVNVVSSNNQPTLDVIEDITLREDDSAQTVDLLGLSTGAANETQTLIITAETSDVSIIPEPVIDYISPNNSGTLVFSPMADVSGAVTITVTVTEEGATENSVIVRSFNVIITSVNDKPTLDPIVFSTPIEEDSTDIQSVDLTGISTGALNEAQELIITATSSDTSIIPNPSISYNSPAAVGTIMFTPEPNQNGTVIISVSVSDGAEQNAIVTESFEVMVLGINDAPYFDEIPAQEAVIGAEYTLNLNDLNLNPTDPDGDDLVWSVEVVNENVEGNMNWPEAGEVENLSGGIFVFRPNAIFSGELEVKVTLTDNGVTNGIFDFKSFDRNVLIDWLSNNDPQIREALQTDYAADEDQNIVITFTNEDKDDLESPDEALTWSIEDFENGTAVVNGNTVTLTPNPNFNINDEVEDVTLILTDANDGQDTKTLSLVWNPINDAPVFTIPSLLEVLEDAPAQGQIWATDVAAGPVTNETESLALFFNIEDNTNPELFSNGPEFSSTGILTFTPAANQNGEADLTVTLSDNGSMGGSHINTSEPQTFTIRVVAVNDAPTFTLGADLFVDGDAGPQTVSSFITDRETGPSDESAQSLNAFVVTNNTNPELFAVVPSINTTGTLTFTSAPDATGSANITVMVSDDGGVENGAINTSAEQTFSITIDPVNDAPTFTSITSQSAPIGQVFTLDLGALGVPQDKENDTLTWAVEVTNPSVDAETLWEGSVVETSTGVFALDPASGVFDGKIAVEVTLTDEGTPSVESSTQTNIIIDWLVNTNPVISETLASTYQTEEGANFVMNLTDEDKSDAEDLDADLDWTISGFAAGTVFVVGNTITFDPVEENYSASNVPVTLILTDRNDGVDTLSLNITWEEINDAPTFTKGFDIVVNEDAGIQSIPGWATNISAGPAESYQVLSDFAVITNSNPSLFSVAPTINSTGTLSFISALNASGEADITIQIADDGSATGNNENTSVPQTFKITVNAVNDAPNFTRGGHQYVEENSGAHTQVAWATNITVGSANEASQLLTFNIVNNSNEALFASGPSIDATGTLTYTLVDGIYGDAEIGLTISDDGGTVNGGYDTSAVQDFTIFVMATNLADYTADEEPSIEVPSTETGVVSLNENISHIHLNTDQNLDLKAGIELVDASTTTINGTSVEETLESISGTNITDTNLQSVNLQSGEEGTAITISTNDSQIEIPDDVTVYASSNWDGTIQPPQNVTSASAEDPDYAVESALEVGSSTQTLIFDKPVKVVIPSVAGAPLYRPDANSAWQPIPTLCNDAVATGLLFPNACYLQEGGETIIWTYHLSQFGIGQAYPICGNGNIEKDEQCDDGNLTRYDGCDQNCKIEAPAQAPSTVTSSGKAGTLRYAGMSRGELQGISGAGVSLDEFEDAYQDSIDQAAKMNEGYDAKIRKMVKRGDEVFVGYQAGKLPVKRLQKGYQDKWVLRGVGRERSRRHATAPKLMPESTTMNIIDVSYNDKYYSAVAKMMALELMDINASHEFRPKEPLSWTLLLNATIRVQSNEVLSLRALEQENLTKLEHVSLSARLRDRIFYTALRDGLIDKFFNPVYLPTQGKTMLTLCRAFDLVSTEEDIDLDSCLVAATANGLLNNIEVKQFNPDILTSRVMFAHWFSRGYAKQEKMLELESFRKRQSKKELRQEDFFKQQMDQLKNRTHDQVGEFEQIGKTIKAIFSL